jgi:KaiC/GvpD/RAD55 family RecA-like ATPase
MMRTSIPDMASVLMIGSPGIGLLEFNIGMVKEYLDNDELVIFVSMDSTPSDLMNLMDEFAIPTKEELGKNLFIIDFHSSLLGNAEESPHYDKDAVLMVADIEGIMFNVAAIVKDRKKPVRIFIYALSTMFLYNQVNVVLKFFQISSSRIRNEYGTVFYSLHDGVHDEKTTNHLMALADGVIELKFDQDLNRMMRIRHMRGMPSMNQWIPFEIRLADKDVSSHVLKWS